MVLNLASIELIIPEFNKTITLPVLVSLPAEVIDMVKGERKEDKIDYIFIGASVAGALIASPAPYIIRWLQRKSKRNKKKKVIKGIFKSQDGNIDVPLREYYRTAGSLLKQTHPSQTCAMSSVDLHTQYAYQIMLPEAIAIVMAPSDTYRQHGIFHLSDPGGVSLIRHCQQRGFHAHEEPSDGSPIYEHCSHVYMNPKLKFEIVDLR
ncbi:uncharacterized protein LOC113310561 [Papaver somniferum]|uniref:uncharacterized protein LOC113310561 n=1 Tax=Papaver somniferum TaxID=3469 RepID=UPI000E6FB3F6|nr:uncharacterized protein LOC113310561 [Papaver somniferum]XP_026415056.1 uncharacterized protein LOC113310561 [Papaver somniferum]XP_026415057.1 uncharacterized protein LOC113310561 [Papaver somniferum]XP_026415058.1 uncharacterized protein LOC113310561 [Papaver somniferum]XP_026415059.1 uncharacterized protein LOC113310561 [Papaver somniferum]XP_026415060.1 uncharacterized protein LOC113310561 [Papaver somniferum]XP_026415062.1 uncharacterized protein LOC113310561 [Papaver somniferum]XP_0